MQSHIWECNPGPGADTLGSQFIRLQTMGNVFFSARFQQINLCIHVWLTVELKMNENINHYPPQFYNTSPRSA